MQVSVTYPISTESLPNKNECTALVSYRAPQEVIRESLEKWRQMPCIVYLKGTCSAGKSTFGRTLENQSKDWVFIDEDLIYIRRYRELFAQRFPKEYAIAACAISSQNLYHAFYRNQVVFHDKASESERLAAKEAVSKVQNELEDPKNVSWKRDAKEQIRSELVEKIQAAFQQHKKVLLDSWLFTAAEIQARFLSARIIRVLLYCPLPIAFDRLKKRNQEGPAMDNIESNRFTGQLMSSFCVLYSMSKKPKTPIESIAKTVLENQFAAMAREVMKANPKGVKRIFIGEEMPQDTFHKKQVDFMQPYEAENTDVLSIEPKDAQDVIINNSGSTQKALDLFISCV